MSVCDIPVISTVCDAVGEGTASLIAAPFDWFAQAVGGAAGQGPARGRGQPEGDDLNDAAQVPGRGQALASLKTGEGDGTVGGQDRATHRAVVDAGSAGQIDGDDAQRAPPRRSGGNERGYEGDGVGPQRPGVQGHEVLQVARRGERHRLAEDLARLRELRSVDFRRAESGLIEARLQADAFCHHMVRAIVGACLAVGEGRRDEDWLRGRLERPVRDSEIRLAPPEGLCLERIAYPQDAAGWADQAERARARRAALSEAPGA